MLLCPEYAVLPRENGQGYAVRRQMGIGIGSNGRLIYVGPAEAAGHALQQSRVDLPDRVLLPGLVNAHSHAHQRLLRGRTQRASPAGYDNFWSWRQQMYQVASQLQPEGLYIAARQLFIEMLLCGVTSVGEFHYLHHQPDGTPYAQPAAMAVALAQAAKDAGIRLCLLRTFYLRGDFDRPIEGHQRRFCDGSLDQAWSHMEGMVNVLRQRDHVNISWGLAAHSIRAVDIDTMVAMKACATHLPMHIHVSEQPREVEACIGYYNASPAKLLADRGVLDSMTTLIHATHLRPGEARLIGQHGAGVCVCPSTEADLGDGLGPMSDLQAENVALSLGSDGHTLSSVIAEAGRLEMHERLRLRKRHCLGHGGENHDGARPATALTAHLLDAATINGARALDLNTGRIALGAWADLVTFDVLDPHLIGCAPNEEDDSDDALLAALLFSGDSRAVADVMVGGRFIVRDGHHPAQEASSLDYVDLARRIFAA